MRKLLLFIAIWVMLAMPAISEIPAAETADPRAIAGYLSGIATAHYCVCRSWPASWDELKRFDDNLYDIARAQGQTPAQRLPWPQLTQSRVTVGQEGQLSIELRLAGSAGLDIGVPVPKDCANFIPKVLEGGCTRPPPPPSRD